MNEKLFRLVMEHPFITIALGIVSSTVLLTLSIAFWLLFIENMMLGIFLGIITYVLVGTVIQMANWYFWAKKVSEEITHELITLALTGEEDDEDQPADQPQ